MNGVFERGIRLKVKEKGEGVTSMTESLTGPSFQGGESPPPKPVGRSLTDRRRAARLTTLTEKSG